MPRLAQIEPAISRLLDVQRDVDTDAIAREVYSLEPQAHPTPSQRAVVTRGMRAFVASHDDEYALAAGHGPAASRIVPANTRRTAP
jgi:hypothetical protein